MLQGQDQRSIQPLSSCLCTVTGETAPIRGKGKVKLKIGSAEMTQDIWIADIQDECILGLDFLEPQGCMVNLREGTLLIGEEEIALEKSADTQAGKCCRAVLEASVQIPPCSEIVVTAKARGLGSSARWGILETQPGGGSLLRDGLLVGRTLVDLSRPTVPVRIMNLTRRKHRVRKGVEIAHCEPVHSVMQPEDPAVAQGTVSEEVPAHLVDLFRRSTDGLALEQQRSVCQLLSEFSDVFSKGPQDLGHTDLVQHHIHTGDATPIRQAPRRLPLAKREEAEQAIQDMEMRGVIEHSASPWSSPIVLVRKKSGELRFCVDYRRLNAITRKDSYPLPRIDETLEALAGAEWFSTLDLQSGYWQVELHPEAKERTAFSTGRGLWQFKVMPFGLCNAPATFERLMEQVLAGLPLSVCLVYIDDILVPGRTFQQGICNLREVLTRLRSAKLKLSPKKCVLFQREVRYLGHVVSGNGVATDPDKVGAVESWPAPSSGTDMQRFLGLCSYYRRFVPSFADIARPLHECVHSRVFEWTPAAERAFVKLKEALTQAPILGYSQAEGEFILDTDASNHGVGAVLAQQQGGEKKVLAYYSRALRRPERNYCVTRRELLAIVKSIQHFHPYLYGRHFVVRTDHAALLWLLSFKHPEGQITRWLGLLQQYNFRVEHRAGLKRGNADALSRRPCQKEDCRHCESLESREVCQGWKQEETPTQVAAVCLQPGMASPDDHHAGLEGFTWSVVELCQAQQEDPDIAPVVKWLSDSEVRPSWASVAPTSEAAKMYWVQWDSLRIQDGVLYRVWETPAGDQSILQLVLPKKLRPRILQQLHGTPTGGHFGVAKTLGKVRERFYWVSCRKDIQEWCRSCDLCASRKDPHRKARAPMGQ